MGDAQGYINTPLLELVDFKFVSHWLLALAGALAVRGLYALGCNWRIQNRWPTNREYVVEAAIAARTLFINALVAVGVSYLALTGVLEILSQSKPSVGMAIIQVIIVTLLHDTYFYWTHRMLHWSFLFKYVHAEHHKAITPTSLSAFRKTVIESFIGAGFFPLCMWLLPFHYTVYAYSLYIVVFYNLVGHSGFEFFPKSAINHPVFKWSNYATHHDYHHSTNYNKNFSLFFTFWDRAMGTLAEQKK